MLRFQSELSPLHKSSFEQAHLNKINVLANWHEVLGVVDGASSDLAIFSNNTMTTTRHANQSLYPLTLCMHTE